MPRAVTTNACGLPPGYVTRLPLTMTRRFPGRAGVDPELPPREVLRLAARELHALAAGSSPSARPCARRAGRRSSAPRCNVMCGFAPACTLRRLVLRLRLRRVRARCRRRAASARARVPRGDHERGDDRDADERRHEHAALDAPAAARLSRAPHADRLHLLGNDVARVELVDVQLPVEPEVVGVRAQESLDVRLAREDVELLVLERLQVLAADLRRRLDLREVEALAESCFPEAGTDLEHARSSVDGSVRKVVEQFVDADGEGRREREIDAERPEEAPDARHAAPADAADRPLRAPPRSRGRT